jgi:hypothetical protein
MSQLARTLAPPKQMITLLTELYILGIAVSTTMPALTGLEIRVDPRDSSASPQCYTRKSCFLGNIFSADHAQVLQRQGLHSILHTLSSIPFGCGFAALCLCSAMSKHRRVLQRFSRSADSLVRKTLALGTRRADKAVRAPLVAA